MTLKAIYSSQDEIPEQYRDLYEERDGQWRLTRIEGMKTEADVANLQSSLQKERSDHKALKERWKGFFGDRQPEDVQADLDRIPELEASQGKVDEEKLNTLVEARVKTQRAPLERDNQRLQADLTKRDQELEELRSERTRRQIHDAVREAGGKAKVVDTAMEDVLMLSERIFEVTEEGKIVAKDGSGIMAGSTPEMWLSDMQQRRPHWWPASQGGGAKGSGTPGFANNPWSRDGWNLTKQGEIVKTQGLEKAQQMAQAAGSKVGATAPMPAK